MKHPDDGPTRPVIIYQQGLSPRAGLMNNKAYHKSLEQGELWTLHPETGRLVPAEDGGALLELRKESGWYMAHLDGNGEQEADEGEADSPEEEARGPAQTPDSVEERPGAAVLLELQELIDRRREELPEGSYTTHLFTKGVDKIRKKTGEEAVELILARSPEETVYEAADLLYHLMVLLSAEGLSISQVLGELRKRHS